MSRGSAPPPVAVEAGQVWRIAKSEDRFFRVVSVDAAQQRAEVVTCQRYGSRIAGRKPYGVTTRSFARGRYVLVQR